MKILFIHTFYAQKGGEDTVVDTEIELLRKDHEVDVLYFQNKTGIKGAFQFLLSIWNIYSSFQVKKRIKKFNPDVIHLHNWHFATGPHIIRSINKTQIPIIQTLHNYRLLCPSAILFHNNELYLKSLEQNFPFDAIKKKVYRNSMFQTFWLSFIVWFHTKIGTWNMIDRYICLTDFSKELFQKSNLKIATSKFISKPNFTDSNIENAKEEREKCFLFIGRLCEEKGIITLINALKNSNHKLKIVGDGPLKNYVQENGKTSTNIEYIGHLSREDVKKILGEIDALIFPSIWFEGMPMTIIEALSTATPIIASNIGAMKSMITNRFNGLLFTPGDENSLLESLNVFSQFNDEEKKKMRDNALLSFEKNYSEKEQYTYFKDIYTFQ